MSRSDISGETFAGRDSEGEAYLAHVNIQLVKELEQSATGRRQALRSERGSAGQVQGRPCRPHQGFDFYFV